jgi:gamma-glutamylcyclotransferase (GGCT)/AIG2-like uncharacterized protein YtfP
MIQRLFVYGTLQPGHANAHLLEEIGGTWQAASVVGTLLPEGWATGQGYPTLTLDERGAEVKGFVFSSEQLAQHWQKLDEFEGEDYERALTAARLEDGRTIETHVYVLNRGRAER